MRRILLTWFGARTRFFAVALAGFVAGFTLAQFVSFPDDGRPLVTDLNRQVTAAMDGHENAAGRYAAFYHVLAGRFDQTQYKTTERAAQVAGRAAEILELPGFLKEIVNDRLNPLLGTPARLSAKDSQAAADVLRQLAAACQEVAQ